LIEGNFWDRFFAIIQTERKRETRAQGMRHDTKIPPRERKGERAILSEVARATPKARGIQIGGRVSVEGHTETKEPSRVPLNKFGPCGWGSRGYPLKKPYPMGWFSTPPPQDERACQPEKVVDPDSKGCRPKGWENKSWESRRAHTCGVSSKVCLIPIAASRVCGSQIRVFKAGHDTKGRKPFFYCAYKLINSVNQTQPTAHPHHPRNIKLLIV